MTKNRISLPEDLLFYLSAPHDCSYLAGKEARTLFADPERPLSHATFSTLSQLGFRRSGGLVYTQRCSNCQACIPVRLIIDEFIPNRSQRRNWRANSDLQVRILDARFSDAHIELYGRYIRSRHPAGSMDVEGREEIERFFLCEWSDTQFLEILLDGRPVALAVIDTLDSGLSAVYTFYEPALQRRALGVFAILAMIEESRRRELPYLYLGYLIRDCNKMAYKAHYQPLEQFRNGQWLRYE